MAEPRYEVTQTWDGWVYLSDADDPGEMWAAHDVKAMHEKVERIANDAALKVKRANAMRAALERWKAEHPRGETK